MKVNPPERLIYNLVIGSFAILLLIILFLRFRLGLVRYFDIDEFLFLNWSYHVSVGVRPYFDFLSHYTPLYPYFVSVIFHIWGGISAIMAARVSSFFIFSLLCLSLIWLFRLKNKSWFGFVTAAALSILPIPSDKFLEIRGDTLAILLIILGLCFQVHWVRAKKAWLIFTSGVFYSFAILVLQKVLPNVVVAAAGMAALILLVKSNRKYLKHLFIFFLGLIIPILVFLLWAIFQGNLPLVLYSVIKLPVETMQFFVSYHMPADLYFRQNDFYYGRFGYTTGYIGNILLWSIGLMVALLKFISLFFGRQQTERKIEELIFIGMLFVQAYFYIFLLPIKFAQYLIPVAVFVAWYIGEAMYLLWLKVGDHPKATKALLPLSWLVVIGFWLIFTDSTSAKFFVTNQADLIQMQKIWSSIPKNEMILDFNGKTIYYPYPYYGCCILNGETFPFLSQKLPSIKAALFSTKTKYIFQGGLPRVERLPEEDRDFISQNYSPSPDGQFLVAKNW